MNLVMFDVDGTLTATTAVDHLCYVQAVTEALGIRNFDTNWTQYRNVTDQGCLEEIILAHTRRQAKSQEISDVLKRFISLLRKHAKSTPDLFQPVPGAKDMLRALERKPDVAVALGTGAWRESAEFKLSIAGLNTSHIPIATSDDEVSRERIMMLAEVRARERYQIGTFETKVYVGDGVWDFKAARELGYEFIGVAGDERAADLREAGAVRIVPDFSDDGGFLRHLETIWNAQPDTPAL